MNSFQNARESLCFYKNICQKDANQLKEVVEELAQIKDAAADGEVEANHASALQWADFQTEHARKALTIGTVLVFLNTCNGFVFVIYYSAMTFYKAELHNVPLGVSKMSIISLYLTISVAKLAAIQTCDHIGRKVGSLKFKFGFTKM